MDFTKARGCYGAGTEPFIATLSGSADSGLRWHIASVEQATKDRLISMLEEAGSEGVRVNDAAEALGVHKSRVSRLRRELEADEIIYPTPPRAPMVISVPVPRS